MPMKNPPHPGRIVREECLHPLGLSVTSGARVLGVSRQALNNLVNQRAGISPEMAIRLAKAFGGNAQTWLRMRSITTWPRRLNRKAKFEFAAIIDLRLRHYKDYTFCAQLIRSVLKTVAKVLRSPPRH